MDRIPLTPWLTLANGAYRFHPTPAPAPALLLSIVSVRPESLPLLGQVQLESHPEAIAYLSAPFAVDSQCFQVAYVPYRQGRWEVESSNSIADILKSFSAVVVTDVVGNGLHRFKDDRSLVGEPHRMVIVNGSVCLFQIKEGVFDITKKAELWVGQGQVRGLGENRQEVSVQSITKLVEESMAELHPLLNCDKNWKVLVDTVLAKYKIEQYLKQGKSWKESLVLGDLAALEGELLQGLGRQGWVRSEQEKEMVVGLLGKLKQQSSSYALDVLMQLREDYSHKQIDSNQQLQQHYASLSSLLSKSHISPQFSSFVLGQFETALLKRQLARSQQREQGMEQLIAEREEQLSVRGRKIEQFKQMIEQFTEKAEQMRKNTLKFMEMGRIYQEEKQKNWKLQLEIQSHLFLSKKSAQSRAELQGRVHSLMREKGELLAGLQELTEQNLHLMGEREGMEEELRDLRDRAEESNLVEARALRSIENEAEVKVRLSRYEDYVRELKQIFSSFKRLESEKFNFILQHNYKEYECLQERLRCSEYELRRAQGRAKELQESLHCERIKLSYYEKMVRGSDPHDTIPEESEESSTEREGQCGQ